MVRFHRACLVGSHVYGLAPIAKASGSMSGVIKLLSETATGVCAAITVEMRDHDGNGSKFGDILYGMSVV